MHALLKGASVLGETHALLGTPSWRQQFEPFPDFRNLSRNSFSQRTKCCGLEGSSQLFKAHLDRVHRAAPVFLGVITLASVLVLFLWDARPGLFSAGAHDVLGALPLALIAFAYMVYQTIRRPGAAELFKAILLSIAFLLWAANQLWPEAARATLYNDLAIGLFVLDVFLVMVGWPASSPDESFAEGYNGQTGGEVGNESGSRKRSA